MSMDWGAKFSKNMQELVLKILSFFKDGKRRALMYCVKM